MRSVRKCTPSETPSRKATSNSQRTERRGSVLYSSAQRSMAHKITAVNNDDRA